MASRNPLMNRSPVADRSSTVGFDSQMRASNPNFQFVEGSKNRQYVSPTYQSNVFGGPSAPMPTTTHRREFNSNVTSPVKSAMDVRPIEQSPIQVTMTPQKRIEKDYSSPVLAQNKHVEAVTPIKKTPPPSAPVMDQSPQLATQSPLYGGVERTADRNQQSREAQLRSSPNRSAHKPRDNDLFAGPRYTPQKDGMSTLRPQTASDSKNKAVPICMQCANEDSEHLKADARKEKLIADREFDRQQNEMMRQLDQQRAQHAYENREMIKDFYNSDLQRSEQKRREALDHKRTDREVVEGYKRQQEEIAHAYERSRQEYNAEMDKFRHDLEDQRKGDSQRRAQDRNTERKLEQQHTGLPIGGYRWDYKDELVNTLNNQMTDKKRAREAQMREEIERGKKQDEEIQRIREWEKNYRAEENNYRNQQSAQIMSDLKDIQAKRSELRNREEDNKRMEREAMNEAARMRRENELREKYTRMLVMNQDYHNQISEKKARLQDQREQQLKVEREAVMRTPAKVHVCNYLNCAKCNRTIPASGAFLE